MLTPELIKVVSIGIISEKAENKALIEEQTADGKVNKAATPEEEVIIKAIQSPKINKQHE